MSEQAYYYRGVDLAELAYADKDSDRLDIVLAALEPVPPIESRLVVTEQGPGEPWLLNLGRYNDPTDVEISQEIGREPTRDPHYSHLTDGRWHDDCRFCLVRRVHGGTGLEPGRKANE